MHSLPSATDDVRLFAEIAGAMRYEAGAPLISPTLAHVEHELTRAAAALQPGDQLLLSFAGHGRKDSKVQSWYLEDGELFDRDLYRLLERFQAGVRVLLISDSCSSGTIAMPFGVRGGIACSLIAMAASADDEYAFADACYGLFSLAISQVWNNGAFAGDHLELFAAARDRVRAWRADQTPQCKLYGPGADEYARCRPFDLELAGPPTPPT